MHLLGIKDAAVFVARRMDEQLRNEAWEQYIIAKFGGLSKSVLRALIGVFSVLESTSYK